MKRVLTWILLLAMLLPMVLVVPGKAEQWNGSMRSEVRSAVSKVITDYARSIAQDSAASNAVQDMGMHALFKNGAFLKLKEGDAMVASLFNANLFQVATTDGITDAILSMQKYCEPAMCVRGGPHWHAYNDSFSYSAYLGTKRDYSQYIGSISSCKTVYGSNTFTGGLNSNDTAMQIIVGGLSCNMVITQGQIKNGKAVYSIKMTISDNFDFNSDYAKAEENGYDATLDRVLVKLGQLMDRIAIDTFKWEFVKDFQIEVPYFCDHQTGAYCWELDTETMSMRAITDGFLVNNATTVTGVNASSGKEYRYYQLENPIQLKHDKPWVIEYEGAKIYGLSFMPSEKVRPSMPFLRHYSSSNVWVQNYEYKAEAFDSEGTATKSTYTYHYWSATFKDAFKFYSKHTYTYRIENVPAANGSNMIYFSVYDNDLGEQVLDPIPLNDYMIMNKGEETKTLISEENNGVSGIDLVINSFGNSSNAMNVGSLKLKIWENGENGANNGSVTVAHKSATCTEDGGLFHTCRECGYSYVTKPEKALGHSYGEWETAQEPGCQENGKRIRRCSRCAHSQQEDISALGHSFGEYVSDGNASCLEDGTISHSCARCGLVETQPDPGSAFGHAFGEYVSDGNASCLEDGTVSRFCAHCGLVDTQQDPGSARGHNLTSWQICAAPSCVADGEEMRLCESCDYSEKQVVAALGHSYGVVTVAPGCTEQGYSTYTCSRCGDSYTDGYTDPLGHNWENPAAIHLECLRCNYSEGGFPVVLTLPEEENTVPTEIWADGIQLPVEQENGQFLVYLPREDMTNLVIYTMNENATEDVHTQYPVGMKVWMLKYENDTYAATYIPEFDNLLNYAGCSIRIAGVKGVRMITSIQKDTKNALTGKGLAGYTLVEYGTALCWADEIEPMSGLTLGQEYTKSNYAYKKGEADPVFKKTATHIQYTNVLVGFNEDQCIPDIAMRPYIILEDAAGQQITIYGGTIYRSIGYIAYQNRNVFQANSKAYKYVWEIIHHVYGNQYEEDYKG